MIRAGHSPCAATVCQTIAGLLIAITYRQLCELLGCLRWSAAAVRISMLERADRLGQGSAEARIVANALTVSAASAPTGARQPSPRTARGGGGAIAVAGFVVFPGFARWLAERALLGAGTALVYPTLIAVIGDAARTPDPATSVGIYRRWRDAGYAVGAIVAGVIADVAGLAAAIVGRVDGDIGSACRGPDQGKHAAPARQQNS